ncbi:hypothetical protein DK853_35475, partial [Klebsiella oxytoca]
VELAHFLHIQLIAVSADESGMSPDALAQVCKNTEVKGIYLMPTCSNPTGIFMPPPAGLNSQKSSKDTDCF